MNVLVIGSGGREYVIGNSLIKNKDVNLYYYGTHSNYGCINISKQLVIGNITDYQRIYNYCLTWKIDYVVIGPEQPLKINENKINLVDFLNNKNIRTVGPSGLNARIETSKSYTRSLLDISNLNSYSPKYYYLDSKDFKKYKKNPNELQNIYDRLNNKVVVKPDGLTGGKGVKIFGEQLKTINELNSYIFELLEDGSNVLLEEQLFGEEFSLFTLTDGDNHLHSPIFQDNKRVDGTGSLMTGGMGVISFGSKNGFLTKEEYYISSYVNEIIIKSLYLNNNIKYNGFLYGSFMKCSDGSIKVIEFNCRMGDPEAINYFHLLKTDLHTLFNQVSNHNLTINNIEFDNKLTISKYLTAPNYPNKFENKLVNLDISDIPDDIIWGSIKYDIYNKCFIMGSRNLAVINSMEIPDNKNYYNYNDKYKKYFLELEKKINNYILKLKFQKYFKFNKQFISNNIVNNIINNSSTNNQAI